MLSRKVATFTVLSLLLAIVAGCGGSKSTGRPRAGGSGGTPDPTTTTEDTVLTKGTPDSKTIHYESSTYTTYISPDGVMYCQKEGDEPKISFTFESATGKGNRETKGEGLRAQVFGSGKAEIEFFLLNEHVRLDITSDGKTTIKGKLRADPTNAEDDPIVVDSTKQHCLSRRPPTDPHLGYAVIQFTCDDGELKVYGTVRVPRFNQWKTDPEKSAPATPPKLE